MQQDNADDSGARGGEREVQPPRRVYKTVEPVVGPVKRRHHQIPQFYLRRFAAPDRDEIWTYDKVGGTARPSKVEATGFEKHLYSVTRDDGTRDIRIEEVLAAIEDKAAPALEKLLRDGQVAGQERADLASFIALMQVRTNAFRRQYAEGYVKMIETKLYATAIHDGAFRSMLKAYQADHGPLTEDQQQKLRECMLDPSRFIMSVARERTLASIGMHDAIVELVFDMRWTLVHPQTGESLVTSDNPVVRYVPPQHRRPMQGPGFRHPHVEMSLPLTPSVCLIGHWNRSAPLAVLGDRENTRLLNRLRAAHSERFLYAPARDAGIIALARKFRDQRPKMQVDGFGPEKRAEVQVRRS